MFLTSAQDITVLQSLSLELQTTPPILVGDYCTINSSFLL